MPVACPYLSVSHVSFFPAPLPSGISVSRVLLASDLSTAIRFPYHLDDVVSIAFCGFDYIGTGSKVRRGKNLITATFVSFWRIQVTLDQHLPASKLFFFSVLCKEKRLLKFDAKPFCLSFSKKVERE